MTKTIIYPGTFDPITNGHIDIIERSLLLFVEVIVAVTTKSTKNPKLSCDTRISLIKEVFSHNKNVHVQQFSGLLTTFAQQLNVYVLLRGLRAVSDFEYEFQLANMNRKLCPKIETIFLPATNNYTYISASMVKEIADLGGNISDLVPKTVEIALRKTNC